MSFAGNYIGFTPDLVSYALAAGVNYRFVLISECESRPTETQQIQHPRFCVGGTRATLDPRNLSILELQPLDSTQIEFPLGWEKVL